MVPPPGAMARRRALWLVLAMPALPISAGSEELQYEHGKLTSIIHFDSFSDYEIVTDSCTYIGRLTAGKETPAARRGDIVRFAIRKRTLFLLDTAGRRHELAYVQQGLLPPLPPPRK